MFKCDGFVRAFHDTRGSSKNFVSASAMFSAKSPYLTDLVRKTVLRWKIIKFLLVTSVTVLVIAVLTTQWLLALIVPVSAATLHLFRLMKPRLIQERAIILAVEALATDFAGWGQLFPIARARAEWSERGDSNPRPLGADYPGAAGARLAERHPGLYPYRRSPEAGRDPDERRNRFAAGRNQADQRH